MHNSIVSINYKSELRVNTNLVFQFEKPMPNAWNRFWQRFLLGWEWRNLTQRAADASPVAHECKHVWLYNVKQDWKVCDKCGQRTARKRRAKGDKFDPRDVSILGGDPSL